MKKNILYSIRTGIIAIVTLCTVQSCNFLDIDPYINDLPTLDSVFTRRETTRQYLANVYSYLPDCSFPANTNGVPWVPISDECLCTTQDNYRNFFNYFSNNNMSAHDDYFQRWAKYYQGIRNAGIFLQRVYECHELSAIELREMVGEAHFLRAYFYFELMKEYGPVVIAPEEGWPLDTPMDELLVPRNSWDECVDFVVNELKLAVENLPETQPDVEFGRPTKGAAYAVMSRLLLYSASPLFNGNTSYSDFTNPRTGEPYINPVADPSKWAEAAWAAKKVIDCGQYELYTVEADEDTPEIPSTIDDEFTGNYPNGVGGIDPYKSYSQLFNGTVQASDNPELIFGRASNALTDWVQAMMPFQMGSQGSCVYNITQKLVDAYYMVDGKTPENASTEYPYQEGYYSPYTETFSGYRIPSYTYGWYLNREARFYATVGFNNSWYYGISTTNASKKEFACKFFVDDINNGKNAVRQNSGVQDQYCMTGYLCRKWLHEEDSYEENGLIRSKVWMDYRLAEIYLNYAEALNELQAGSYTVEGETFSRNTEEIRHYFNLVRFRAGLPGMTAQEASDYNTVRDMIRRERQIELAWEGHRYFDVRRWEIANVEENEPIYGVDINQSENNPEAFYQKVVVREAEYTYKSFVRRQNFWPIPNDEIIRNPNLVQSPGW